MDEDNGLSPAEIMAMKARQSGRGGEQTPPRMRMVSFRVPASLLVSVDALANVTGQSRNTTMIELLEVGVYGVVNELDDTEQYEAIREHLLDKNSESGD